MSHSVKQATSLNQEWHTLKNRWVRTPRSELLRLKQDPGIADSFEEIRNKHLLNDQQLIAYGHSLEALHRFGDRYFVFNHGQNLDLMVLNIFAKEIVKRAEPSKDVSGFHVLRHDSSLKNANDWTVPQAKSVLTHGSDHDYRSELLCVDGYLENYRYAESAISFFNGLDNIAKGYDFARNLYQKIIRHYVDNKTVETQAANELVKLARNLPSGGNLYTICVPKDKFEDLGYRAHPFGTPCDHQQGSSETEVLEDLQTRKRRFCDMSWSGQVPPQYRLLNKKLTKENGVHIFVNSTLSKDQVKNLKASIRKVVDLLIPVDDKGRFSHP